MGIDEETRMGNGIRGNLPAWARLLLPGIMVTEGRRRVEVQESARERTDDGKDAFRGRTGSIVMPDLKGTIDEEALLLVRRDDGRIL